MFTLIALGTGVAWVFSTVATFAPGIFPPALRMPDGSVAVYFEAAAVIVVLVLLGQLLELRARERTTLLTLLGCLREVQEGEVVLLGEALHGAPEALRVAARRRLGFIFQAHNLHESLTATQNVRIGLDVHGQMPGADEVARHALRLLRLEDRLNYLPANLSGGQKQRVAAARALVGSPEIIFADEPTAALDWESARLLIDILRRLARERGTTTVMVTHDARIMALADRILTLEDGHLVRDEKA